MKTLRTLLLLALFASIPMIAQDTSSADLRNLTKEQQLEVLQKVEESKKLNQGKVIAPTTPEQMSKWIGLGKDVAELIPVFAEKTGIAADKVLGSFSGKVLLTIVLVHFFWSKIAGILLLCIGLPTWWMWFKRMFLIKEQTKVIHPNTILAWFGRTKTITTYGPLRELLKGKAYDSVADLDCAWLTVSFVCLLGVLVVGSIGIMA